MNSAIKNSLLFVFLLIFSGREVFAQRSGYHIKNYTPKDYLGFNQMWQATQDKNGLLYFAGTSSIFVFDGTTFQNVLVKSGSANRQIMIDSTTGIIYVGAVGEFGYLQRDSVNGKLGFVSLTTSLDSNQKTFSDIWKVFGANGKIYFQSTERIFICKEKKIIGTIEASREKGFALMFQSNGKLFVRQRTVGLMEIVNDKLQLCPGGERFANTRLLGMIPWKNQKSLIVSSDSGFFVMDPKLNSRSVTWFSTLSEKADTFSSYHGALGCEWVNDSTFAVFTRSGIGFYNRNAQLIEILNKKSGLGDESIADVFVDRQKNIWLMHNNGISKVSYNSPALFFSDQSGFSGTLQWLIRYQGNLFAGTTEGLFIECSNVNGSPSNLRFKRVEEIPHTEVWNLTILKGDLFISTSEGLFYSHNGKIEKFSSQYINRVCESPNPDEFIAMEKGGMSVYSFIDGHLPKLIRHYEIPGEDIIRIGRINYASKKNDQYDFWCANRFKEVIHARFNVNDTNFTIQRYDTTNGLPMEQTYMVVVGDSTYFFSGTKAYRYIPSRATDPKSKCFSNAPEIFDLLFDGNFIGLKPPFDYSLFLQTNISPLITFYGMDSKNKFFRTKLPIGYCFGGNELQYVYSEPNGIAWLLSNSILLRYNSNINPPSDIPFNTIISSVKIGKDSTIYFGSDNINFTNAQAIPYQFNSIVFKFSAPYYELDGETNYLYKLEGFDTTWYPVKGNPEKSYTNLSEGKYTFKVKMYNLLGRTSNEGSYTFTILPPWYRTTLAYILFVLAFLGIIFISVRLSARRLRTQKEKLEIIVQERTAEVVEQKVKIEIQNSELEYAYKGIQDSIHYAERIQHAILPMQSEIHNSFPDSFVLFHPRDIVSGDFYWFVKRGNLTWIACVDCTGHGVPGAFMSMIGNTLLNEIVLEKNIESPDKILNLLHIRIRQALHQDMGGETRDGMDISLCLVDFEKKKLSYAGANRPLWMMRKNQMIVFPANKYSIGGDHGGDERFYTLHETELNDGDCFYLTSDGYADQFGGDRGKKLMVKRFQEMLQEIHLQPMPAQYDFFEKSFLDWKGKLEQVDDVLVIGFRYKT